VTDYPAELTTEQVKATYPELKASVVLVAIGARLYKRDGNVWYLLDDRPVGGC
jgi:hypothetical protein